MQQFRRVTAWLVCSMAILASAAYAQSGDPIKLAVGVDAAYVPMYLAKQRKLFEKHGANVEIVQFTQGGDSLDALVAGQVAIGAAAQPTTLIRAARADIKTFGIFGHISFTHIF